MILFVEHLECVNEIKLLHPLPPLHSVRTRNVCKDVSPILYQLLYLTKAIYKILYNIYIINIYNIIKYIKAAPYPQHPLPPEEKTEQFASLWSFSSHVPPNSILSITTPHCLPTQHDRVFVGMRRQSHG